MSIISNSYFVQEINIPTNSDNSNIDDAITRYEPEILKIVLGYELWDLIKDSPTTPSRLNELIIGKEYTVSYNGRDQKVKWNGLANTDLKSLIAYYVYFMWQTNHVTTTSNLGEKASLVETAQRADPSQKTAHAWYLMRQLVGFNGQNLLEPSLYNFLTEYTDTYPEWVFTDVGRVNMFGI